MKAVVGTGALRRRGLPSAAGPLPRRSALQAARSRDATALRSVQADAGRLGAADLSPLGGTGALRRRGLPSAAGPLPRRSLPLGGTGALRRRGLQ